VRQGSSSPVKLLDTSFQQLSHVGFCVAEGNCLRAPVLVTQQQQQQQGPVHKGGQQQAALAQQEDFQRFAEFVLGAQAGSASNHQDGDAATGNWYRWDMSQQAGGAAPSIGQKHSAGECAG
jgi:hypothetical protein